MDAELRTMLDSVGIDPDGEFDPAAAWQSLHERYGARVTIIERYALEAHRRGVTSDELPRKVRVRLSRDVLSVQFPGIELIGESGGEPVDVVPYDPGWPDRYADWRARLAAALGDAAVTIHHVGSTSVPGLAAKPVIDIEVGVADLEDESAYVPAIESTGVSLRSRDSLHRYFRPAKGQPRVVHVHVCTAHGEWAVDHVVFRDYLRADPAVRDAYASLKAELATRYRDDRLAYTDAKARFILDALDSAKAWAAETGWVFPPE